MKKEKDIINVPVLDKTNGKKIASVKDIIYSKTKFRIIAFLVSEKGIFTSPKIIKFKEIDSFGEDVVMVNGKTVIEDAEVIPEITSLLKEKRKIIGEGVLSEDGEDIGIIRDTVFDEESGKVLGFIITNGVFDDMREGRFVLPYIKGIKFGEDVLIVPNQIKGQVEKNKETFKKLLELH